jgi:MFS family permease
MDSILDTKRGPSSEIALAIVVNMSMGVLYVWGLFLLPLERDLSIGRAGLSIVPGVALVCFTIGMVIHAALLRRLGVRKLTAVAFALAAAGHLVFAFWQGYAALLFGYGVMFGLGAGLGYGAALAIAACVPDNFRSVAVGLVMASFVASGLILPLVFGNAIAQATSGASFGIIGLVLLLIGTLVVIFLPNDSTGQKAVAEIPAISWASRSFLRLALIFFLICFVGLLVVSQLTGIIVAKGLPRRIADFGPVLFTLGYLGGSLLGGRVVERLLGRKSLVLSGLIAMAGVLSLFGSSAALILAGAALIGLVFGGSASLMPILIGELFGVALIGQVYGRLMIAYGAAGLVAPWLSGFLFAETDSYFISLMLAFVASAATGLLGSQFKA